MKETKKEYVGFIKAFNAKNIASLEDTLEFKIEEMSDLFKDIADSKIEDGDIKKASDRLTRALKSPIQDITSKLFTSGELLKSSLPLLKDANSTKTRQVILVFGQIAKLTDDKNLKQQAIELGTQFLSE
jgi:hypothetical protein